jgi:small subunit ribosomal protein S14
MTTSDWKKIMKQLKVKPVIAKKFIKHNKPRDRKQGVSVLKCKRCGRFGGHLNQYNLHLCRHCFREIAEEIGFKKYS